MTSGAIIAMMAVLFVGLGYLGVPVAFSIMAGVLVATAFTPISFASIVGQLFRGRCGSAARSAVLPAGR